MKKQQQFFAFPVKLSKSTCAKFCNDNGINCVTVCVQNQIPTLNSCCLLHQSVPSIQPVWLYLYSTCVQDPTGLVRPPINHWKHMFLCLAAETIQSKLGETQFSATDQNVYSSLKIVLLLRTASIWPYACKKKSKCSEGSHSSAKFKKLCQLRLLNTHQSHKAYCAWCLKCVQQPYSIKLQWTRI